MPVCGVQEEGGQDGRDKGCKRWCKKQLNWTTGVFVYIVQAYEECSGSSTLAKHGRCVRVFLSICFRTCPRPWKSFRLLAIQSARSKKFYKFLGDRTASLLQRRTALYYSQWSKIEEIIHLEQAFNAAAGHFACRLPS